MGLFDIFTGAPAKEAANQQRGVYEGATTQIGNLANITRQYNEDVLRGGYGDARNNLTQGYNTARSDLGTGFNNARDDLTQGYNAATGAINTGASGALGYLDEGASGALGRIDAAKGGIGGAFQPLSDLAGRFRQGSTLYGDALGLGGAAGTQRAQDAFTAGPGYQFMLDQGIEAINRKRNAAGSLVGGNADRDAQNYGMGLAKQEYGSWLDRLSPYNQYELSATSGAATGTAGENAARGAYDLAGANILDASGRAKAGVATNQGNSLSDLASRYYGSQASADTAEGSAMSDLASRYFGNLANSNTGEAGAITNNMWQGTTPQIQAQMNFAPKQAQTYMDEANASLQGTKNLWNMGIQAATTAAGLPFGSMFSSTATPGFTGSATNGLDPYNSFGNTLSFGGPR